MPDFLQVATRAARAAGRLINRHRGKIRDISYKGEINLVTDVDEKAEKLILSILRKNFPKHDYLAEEMGENKNNSVYRWIIDPLDGTTNFAHQFPFYSVSIALEYKSDIIISVVYDPVRKETFTARKGKGARLNGRKISVSDISKLKDAMLATGFAYDFKKAHNSNIENFVNFLGKSQAVRRAGSAALDLCYVACGRFDGFWECDLHPWDTAGGWLIAKEANGKVTKFNGDRYSCFDKELVASNGKIHDEMVKILVDRKWKT